MFTLSKKHVAVVGQESNMSKTLVEELKSHGVLISDVSCTELTPEKVAKDKYDLIILNHLGSCDDCVVAMEKLKNGEFTTPVPIFSVVKNDKENIEKALADGSADYITVDESVESVMTKLEAILSEDELFSGTAIDITDEEADVSLTDIRVFVVEDDPLLRNLLATKFNRTNFPHEFSPDGSDVIHAMKSFKPDILVLDLMLPGRSGFEVLDEVKQQPEFDNLPVIIFSNIDSAEDKQRAKTYYGIDNFYIKAMTDLSELVKKIEIIVKSK